jgi:N-acetylglutamate synthase-like GNAT family acetyltransferase
MEIQSLNLYNLIERPEHLLTLAQWHHHQWSFINPGLTLEDRIGRMRDHLEPQPVPTTLVLEADGHLIGSAALIESDMDTHPEWTPWLASVYVAPPYRQLGFGSRLIEAIVDFANQQGLQNLYLFTPDKMNYYQKRGWSICQEEIYRKVPVTVMTIDLPKSAD